MDADEELVAQLALNSANPRGRAAACAALAATTDPALAARCVAPLIALLGQPVALVPRAEFSMVSTLLAHLVGLDAEQVGGEYLRDGRWLGGGATVRRQCCCSRRQPPL